MGLLERGDSSFENEDVLANLVAHIDVIGVLHCIASKYLDTFHTDVNWKTDMCGS